MTMVYRMDQARAAETAPIRPIFGPVKWLLGAIALASTLAAHGGPLDPDCTAGKAAKSAAMKTTVGVGGRCSPKEAATDSAKGAAGIEDKGPLEKNEKKKKNKGKKDKDDGLARKGMKKVLD